MTQESSAVELIPDRAQGPIASRVSVEFMVFPEAPVDKHLWLKKARCRAEE